MKIIKAMKNDIQTLMSIRMEMLRVVNDLSDDSTFDENFKHSTREYFENADQTTVLALDGEEAVGCATICYIDILPTFDHPTGKRAHVMNVYTRKEYRRQGIALEMMKFLIDEAKDRGVTEISLDATKAGRPLYERCGFESNAEGMVLEMKGKLRYSI
ncbi:MAG: GNAT family N-acetyltransferase [Oscillospiraceae bacterium]|nr:GNAT family N-acetyltransferase [Oscillospiraceae bacterium]